MVAIILYYYMYLIIYRGKTKASIKEGRDRTRAKDSADLFARSSPIFCSVCCLHRPHHRQPLTTSPASVSAQGEGRAATSSDSGRCHRHHIATTSPPIDQQPATTGQRLDVLPSCPHRPRPRPFFPSAFVSGSCYSSP